MDYNKEIELVKEWAQNDIEAGITLGESDFEEFKDYCEEKGVNGTWELFSVYLDTVEGMPVEVSDDQMEFCDWCGEAFPHGELHNEKDLGHICDRCKKGIISRGEEFVELSEGYNKEDFAEVIKLADEIGLKTAADMEQFSKDHPGDFLTELRKFRAELGDDFNLPDEERGITAAEKEKVADEVKHFLAEPEDEDDFEYDDPLHVMKQLPEEFNADFIDETDPEDDIFEAAIKVKEELDEKYKEQDFNKALIKDLCIALAEEGEAYAQEKSILEDVIAKYLEFQEKSSKFPKHTEEDFAIINDGGAYCLRIKE